MNQQFGQLGFGKTMKDDKGYFKPEQIHPIIETSPYPYNLVFLVAWETGRRISEIVKSKDVEDSVGIKKKDLDLLTNSIRFWTLKARTSGDFMWVSGVPKTLMKELWKLVKDKNDEDLVFKFEDFHNRKSIANYRIHVTTVFRKICESIGIKIVGRDRKHPHIHHLRHSAIMYMYAKNFRPEEIQLKTGHRNINNLLYYIKVMENEKVEDKFKELAEEEDEWLKEIFNK